MSERGRVGCILPSGIATDDTTKEFFAALVSTDQLASLWHFENEEFVFPAVHHAFRFCLVTMARGRAAGSASQMVFYARQVAHLNDPERLIELAAKDFVALNPNTRTCPTFRWRRDAEINKGIYRRVPVLWREEVEDGNPWGIRFLRMLDMSVDSGSFHDRAACARDGFVLAGNVFARGGAKRLPLYEAKMVHHFDHRFATYEGQTEAQSNQGKCPELDDTAHADPLKVPLPYYWVDDSVVHERLADRWARTWLLGWRDIARSSDMRTVIVDLLPRFAVGNKLPLCLPDQTPPLCACLFGNLASLVLDYCARQKVAGTSLNVFLVNQFPVLAPQTYSSSVGDNSKQIWQGWVAERVLELTYTSHDMAGFAMDAGYSGPPFRWDPERRAILRAELDAAFFHLYGLDADDTAYILDTFPVLRDKEVRQFGEYRTRRLVLERYAALATAIATRTPYTSPLSPPPASPLAAHPGNIEAVASAAEADGTRETLYITRGSATEVRIPGVKIATYTTRLGRAADAELDTPQAVAAEDSARKFRVVQRVTFVPRRGEHWDAIDDHFELLDLERKFASLRALVGVSTPAQVDDYIAELEREDQGRQARRLAGKRRVIDRMSLRDQPLLNALQGEIFRLPLDRQVFLEGPPGTGKTTTLIRRIARTRNADILAEEEQDLIDATGTRDIFSDVSRWVMFSPTSLLQLYLREAFNREKVPAASYNLLTWPSKRRELARGALGFLRAPDNPGGFELDEELVCLADESSPALARLHDELKGVAESAIVTQTTAALAIAATSTDPAVVAGMARLRQRIHVDKIEVRDVMALLEEGALLTPAVDALKNETDQATKTLVASLVRPGTGLSDELLQQLADLSTQRGVDAPDGAEDDDDDAESTPTRAPGMSMKLLAARVLQAALADAARAVHRQRRPGARTARVLEILGDRAPAPEALRVLGQRLDLLSSLRTIARAPQRLLTSVASAYQRMRGVHRARLLRTERTSAAGARVLTPSEVDIIVLVMLGTARRFFEQDRRRLERDIPLWLARIRDCYLAQVFVDEATDFSAVQLACMAELAHPRVRSWFAAGDFRQRITAHGTRDASELEWLAKTTGLPQGVDRRPIVTAYRQSPPLRRLAEAMDGQPSVGPSSAQASGADDADGGDPLPLLRENLVQDDVAEWISARLEEIEDRSGTTPSIAILVDGDAQVEAFAARLKPAVRRHSLSVVGCPGGLSIGDGASVRVFDVRHIKGLEFEAVFFVGIDALERSLPGLFDRFLYVGVTRAATFLGVTCEGGLPSRLEHVRDHFSGSTWTISD
jgi:hypothetical protein